MGGQGTITGNDSQGQRTLDNHLDASIHDTTPRDRHLRSQKPRLGTTDLRSPSLGCMPPSWSCAISATTETALQCRRSEAKKGSAHISYLIWARPTKSAASKLSYWPSCVYSIRTTYPPFLGPQLSRRHMPKTLGLVHHKTDLLLLCGTATEADGLRPMRTISIATFV